eukprot:GHRR01030326.1.p2 GENE.GHRR01030326.1~~GHRR01030326.1.p2  ORF type:complete len:135 (+),score=19.48 GHRR01030326.1:121-525(+)
MSTTQLFFKQTNHKPLPLFSLCIHNILPRGIQYASCCKLYKLALLMPAGEASTMLEHRAFPFRAVMQHPGRLRFDLLASTCLCCCSGAGKTTLMDVLAGRKTVGRIEGEITVGGFAKQQETFARILGEQAVKFT